jgi:nucleoside-diphosphate-sugar epimerase
LVIQQGALENLEMTYLITGNLGYVGSVVSEYLKKKYPERKIIGYDIGLFANLIRGVNYNPDFFLDFQHIADVRNFDENILKGVDHVIHLAAISNDPIGNKFEKITNEINFEASIDILKKSVKMKVKSFTFASSCSVYGSSLSHPRSEKDEAKPLTAYAKSKIDFEEASKNIPLEKTMLTSLRFATACGFSPRVRLDLVLNDFVASALKTKKIEILSDGSSFRPLIHVKDMARAIDWSTSRKNINKDQNFFVNVGSNKWNYQIKNLAEKTSKKIGNCSLFINKNASSDKRSYKVDFNKYNDVAPNHKCIITLDEAIDDLIVGLKSCEDLTANFRNSNYIRLNCLENLINTSVIDNNLSIKI